MEDILSTSKMSDLRTRMFAFKLSKTVRLYELLVDQHFRKCTTGRIGAFQSKCPKLSVQPNQSVLLKDSIGITIAKKKGVCQGIYNDDTGETEVDAQRVPDGLAEADRLG